MQQIIEKINRFYAEKPLHLIVFLALIVRLVAVMFSQGYGMHDDHFLVIEISQSWADGTDYGDWLPKSQVNPQPGGHSFFYPGLHYYLFKACQMIGFNDPVLKMYLVRLIHALFSLLIVIYGYKITKRLSNTRTANQVGLFLALLWFVPNMSVRNLVEIVCIPFLMISTWQLLVAEERKHKLFNYFIAGIVMGLAFTIRYQTMLFIGGAGLALLISGKWKEPILFGFGALVCIFMTQGLPDMIIWHKPFCELQEYIKYNIAARHVYGTDNNLMYFEIVLGFLIPPVSFFLFFGFLRTWKKHLLIFLPTAIFFLFHTFFSNKQERFIMSIIPFIVILGFIGWNEFVSISTFWGKRPNLIKGCFTFFWVINILALILLSTSYSKRSRVESMVYLSRYKSTLNSVIVEDSNRDNATFFPSYYSGKWLVFYNYAKPKPEFSASTDTIINFERFRKMIHSFSVFSNNQKIIPPGFVLFVDADNLPQRVANVKKVFPNLQYETTIEPSFLDNLIQKLNPVNKNYRIFIYMLK